jgi:hypothetical protein
VCVDLEHPLYLKLTFGWTGSNDLVLDLEMRSRTAVIAQVKAIPVKVSISNNPT